MSRSGLEHEGRLTVLLEKLLEPGFDFPTDSNLNSLVSHLSGHTDKETSEQLLNLPIFVDWLKQAVEIWESHEQKPSDSVLAFIVYAAWLISQEQARFEELSKCDFYYRISSLVCGDKAASPSVKLAYVKLLTCLIRHPAGLEWLKRSASWKELLRCSLDSQTLYVKRESQSFIFALVSETSQRDAAFCSEIVAEVMAPLAEIGAGLEDESVAVDDRPLQKALSPTLKLLGSVLEKCHFAESEVHHVVPGFFMREHALDAKVGALLAMAHDMEFLYDIGNVLLLVHFLSIEFSKLQTEYEASDHLMEFTHKVYEMLQLLINKHATLVLIKLCHECQYYWTVIRRHKMPRKSSEEDHIYYFQNQIIAFQIMPTYAVLLNSTLNTIYKLDEIAESYMNKFFKISCERTIRMAYVLRTLLKSEPNLYKTSLKAILFLMQSRKYLEREQAVFVFQTFVHGFKCIQMEAQEKTAIGLDILTRGHKYMAAVLDGLYTLIDEFKITWRESLETTCVLAISLDFLNLTNTSYSLTVQALKLVDMSIASFLPPNLALLVDSLAGSSLTSLGPMLYMRMHDMNWEVRDSTLELICTVATIAHTKFPAFQKMMRDENICTVVVSAATSDTESFVRASAIRALIPMVRISSLWSESLERDDLPEKMLTILLNESEGIVRCQAAKLMTVIQEQHAFKPSIVERVFSTMACCVACDLHWEVKINALNYWQAIIDDRLNQQGMIDGTFPSVTFSKEDRKIVNLTEVEVRNRLKKIMNQLSECGCLGVLQTAIQNDCDLQVTKRAVEIAKKLMGILTLYGVSYPAVKNLTSTSRKAIMDSSSEKTKVHRKDDPSDVIDSIVESCDVNLLASVFKLEMKTNHVNSDVKYLTVVSPEMFFTFMKRDLDLLIKERCDWFDRNDDLSSLLDDILKSYDNKTEANDLDCY